MRIVGSIFGRMLNVLIVFGVVFVGVGFFELGMLVGCVIDDKVKYDVYVFSMCFLD